MNQHVTGVMEGGTASLLSGVRHIYCDAGMTRLELSLCDAADRELKRLTLPVGGSLEGLLHSHGLADLPADMGIYVTGRLRDAALRIFGHGERVTPPAALWAAAQELVRNGGEAGAAPLAVVEISASGYLLVGVDESGRLHEDVLTVNPRCGAGSGVNLDRVLQKLGMRREEVDAVLADYLGEAGAAARQRVNVRADRCGVFASSATISDKNQGIPLSFALAVTLKSEVLKACKRLPDGFRTVWLSGGIFRWRYARDCAEDHFRARGVEHVCHEGGDNLSLVGLQALVRRVGHDSFHCQGGVIGHHRRRRKTYPGFATLKARYERERLYRRMRAAPGARGEAAALRREPLLLAIDAGSTMAKVVVTGADSGRMLHLGSHANAGDTIQTIKAIFTELKAAAGESIRIRGIGLTGSARYQVQKVLNSIYPQLADRITVLVENYAHARGSIDEARDHVAWLRAHGVSQINEDFVTLVDVGGEDTKITTIALREGELFDNAMNVKCSAGTGSLMDTLAALFGAGDAAEANRLAFSAARGHAINATCAVFLMENARKLQLEGIPEEEILASASWAVVANMARTLWDQIELPKGAVALLHGQTMLSDPLPLAVTHLLQEHAGRAWCLVPPHPGHRACLGLIATMREGGVGGDVRIRLDDFIDRGFERRLITCRGAACHDPGAVCNRCHLSARDDAGRKFSITLGGCSAINELLAARKGGRNGHAGHDGRDGADGTVDAYAEIHTFIDARLPHTDDPARIVVPRSFAVSEYAGLFAFLMEELGHKAHVDNVREQDILDAQPHFRIDTCAPHIGAVGQMLRLAKAPHGAILAPQIGYLPTGGHSLGRTCTINQGGMATARALALEAVPEARIHLFTAHLRDLDPAALAEQLHAGLGPLLAELGVSGERRLREATAAAMERWQALRAAAAERAAELIEAAMAEGRPVALVIGREYILNPGIYDSHVGRLLRDKGVIGIPAYILDVAPNPEFGHIYWRNPHLIATLADAFARGEVWRATRHPRLRALLRRIEEGEGPELMAVQVSTFQCGPDSVTIPLVRELTRNRPYLFIQSDSVIKELAHLENRMNTYVHQVESGLHRWLAGANGPERFEVRTLDRLINDSRLDPARDVLAVPTLSDNRPLIAVLKAAGFVCLENYDDDSHDLEAAVRRGREQAGDAVCAPLAAVYGDVLAAIEAFERRKRAGDPTMAGKSRLIIINNKGLGPCRQGQYVENHKLFLHRQAMNRDGGPGTGEADFTLQFLVAHENRGFDVGMPRWAYLRAIQSVVLQGVLHRLLFAGGAVCRDAAAYERFLDEYRTLKEELNEILERRLKPTPRGLTAVRRLGGVPVLGGMVKFFAWRFHARDLQRALARFSRRWRLGDRHLPRGLLRLHVEGEVYMRVSQVEAVNRALLSSLGLGRFHLDYSPLWCFLDYKLAGMAMRAREAIATARRQMRNPEAPHSPAHYRAMLRSERRRLRRLRLAQLVLRQGLAAPLYRAAGIAMPMAMTAVLDEARAVIPTRRPGGELVPFVGEVLHRLREGYDLVFNVAPEGCMVSSMGEVLSPAIAEAADGSPGRIQPLFSQQGDVDEELIALALLKRLGPEGLYRARGNTAAMAAAS